MTVEEYLLGQRSEKVHKGVKKQGITTNFSYFQVISEKKDNFSY